MSSSKQWNPPCPSQVTPADRRAWAAHYKAQGQPVFWTDGKKGAGAPGLKAALLAVSEVCAHARAWGWQWGEVEARGRVVEARACRGAGACPCCAGSLCTLLCAARTLHACVARTHKYARARVCMRSRPRCRTSSHAPPRAPQSINAKRSRRGLQPRPVRACVIGFPNIGKSALINRLLARRAMASAPKPGVTRMLQWARLSGELDLLDAPGVIPAAFNDQVRGVCMCACACEM